MRVAVIGGGPAGLVTLKYLIQAHKHFPIEPLDVILFEAEDDVAGTFWYRSYENAELVSSRQLTSFSDFRIPDNQPDFVSTEYYCSYLRKYCDHFKLWPHIKLSARVRRVTRSTKGGHRVFFTATGTSAEEEFHCNAVAICTGLHVVPNRPHVKGIEFVPRAIHSSEFKQRSVFDTYRDVLILGVGETGTDLAHLAVTSATNSVTLCHRNGWQNAPKRFPDPIIRGDVDAWQRINDKYGPMPPTDCGSASLFDTAYVHPMLERSMWLWSYYDAFTKKSSWVISGTECGLDQWVGGLDERRLHASKIIPNKSNNAMPYINVPYKPKDRNKFAALPGRPISLPPFDTGRRHIDLAPWPEYIDEHGQVHFRDTGRPESERMKEIVCKPDLVIFATGYTQEFAFLDSDYATPDTANVRRVWKAGQEDVGFIGFVRPNFGAIPPLAEMQAQLWIATLLGQVKLPLADDESYRLRLDTDRRVQYAVDHDTYVYRLALDLRSAPSMLQVLRFGIIVFATWALGPNFNTKFRLVGPWKWDGAADIMRGELWHVICRRRSWFVWLFLSILPMSIFGAVNLACFIIFGPLDLLQYLGQRLGSHLHRWKQAAGWQRQTKNWTLRSGP